MTNGNESAYPKHNMVDGALCVDGRDSGLSKREYFAGLFMQALIANPSRYTSISNQVLSNMLTQEEASAKNAHKAVLLADALVAELNKQS